MISSETLKRPRSSLESAEFFCVVLGVLFSSFASLRHPGASFTVSDFFITFGLLFRFIRAIPLYPMQAASSMWWLGIAMLMTGLLIGSIAYGDPVDAVVVLIQYFFSFVALPLAILGRPHKEAVLLAKMGVMSVVISCLVGLGAYSIGYNGGHRRQLALVAGNNRLTGLTDNANAFAAIIVLWFPVLWYLGLVRAYKMITFACFFALTFTGLIFTSSNSNLAGALISGAIYLFLLGKFRIFFIWSAVFAVTAWVGITFADKILPQKFVERVLSPLQQGNIEGVGTFSDRAELMIEAWRFLPDYYVLGMGAEQYRELSSHDLPVHNLYLLLANEGGLMSLMGLLFLYLAAITYATLAGPDTPYRTAARTTVITATLTFAALMVSFTHIYHRAYLVPWIVSIGLLYSPMRPDWLHKAQVRGGT